MPTNIALENLAFLDHVPKVSPFSRETQGLGCTTQLPRASKGRVPGALRFAASAWWSTTSSAGALDVDLLRLDWWRPRKLESSMRVCKYHIYI